MNLIVNIGLVFIGAIYQNFLKNARSFFKNEKMPGKEYFTAHWNGIPIIYSREEVTRTPDLCVPNAAR